MSQRPLQLDYANNAYFILTLSRTGTAYSAPAALADLHPKLNYVGRLGELDDIHLYSTPTGNEDVVHTFLKERKAARTDEGIVRIDFPEDSKIELRQRGKREEL